VRTRAESLNAQFRSTVVSGVAVDNRMEPSQSKQACDTLRCINMNRRTAIAIVGGTVVAAQRLPGQQREMNPSQPFLMPIEDVFSIRGRGTVVTGRIESGVVKVGEEVEIVGLRETRKTVVTGVEMFKKPLLDEGRAGDNVGLLLRGIEKDAVERGQVLAKPGSIKPHKKFKGEVYVLSKEEGGSHAPFFNGYRPQFYFWTTDVKGVAHLPAGTKMVMPGDNAQMEIELITPVAMDKGLRFAIREGGRTVGLGVVVQILR